MRLGNTARAANKAGATAGRHERSQGCAKVGALLHVGVGVAAILGAIALGTTALPQASARAQAPTEERAPAVPRLSSPVEDRAQLLSAAAAQRLRAQLLDYQQSSGHQLALLTLPSLQGEAIEDFALKVAEQWRLGDKARDDGLLVMVAAQERKMRIEVGYGLEGAIPDALAARIVREVMAPAFRAGQYDKGITDAFAVLMKAAAGESTGLPPKAKAKTGGALRALLPFLFPMLFLLFALGRGGRGGGAASFLGGYAAASVLGGMAGRRGGFGGGGDGFGGFAGGGGGFGGGGASGGW